MVPSLRFKVLLTCLYQHLISLHLHGHTIPLLVQFVKPSCQHLAIFLAQHGNQAADIAYSNPQEPECIPLTLFFRKRLVQVSQLVRSWRRYIPEIQYRLHKQEFLNIRFFVSNRGILFSTFYTQPCQNTGTVQ